MQEVSYRTINYSQQHSERVFTNTLAFKALFGIQSIVSEELRKPKQEKKLRLQLDFTIMVPLLIL